MIGRGNGREKREEWKEIQIPFMRREKDEKLENV